MVRRTDFLFFNGLQDEPCCSWFQGEFGTKKERYLFGVLTELYNDACRKKNEAVKRSVELTKLSKGYCGPEPFRELKNRCKLK